MYGAPSSDFPMLTIILLRGRLAHFPVSAWAFRLLKMRLSLAVNCADMFMLKRYKLSMMIIFFMGRGCCNSFYKGMFF